MLLNVTEKDTRIQVNLDMDARLIKTIGLQNAYMYYVLKEIQRAQDCYYRYYHTPPVDEYGSFVTVPFEFEPHNKEIFVEEMYIQQYFGIPIALQKMLLYNLRTYKLITLRVEGFFCKCYVTINTYKEYIYIHSEDTDVSKEHIFEQLDDFLKCSVYTQMSNDAAWKKAFGPKQNMFIQYHEALTLNKLNAYRYMYIAVRDNEIYTQPFAEDGMYSVLFNNDNEMCVVPIMNLTENDLFTIYALNNKYLDVVYDSSGIACEGEVEYIAVKFYTDKLDAEWRDTDYYKQTYKGVNDNEL